MIKKIGRYIVNKLHFLIPESILIRYAEGIFDKKDTSFITLIVRNAFSERYKNASPEQKKHLGFLVWRSKAATQYFKDRTFSETIIDRILSIIQKNIDLNVCEIGTGNGNLINILSERSPNHHFCGVDLNEEQININKKIYEKNFRIRFICADILKYIQNNINSPTIYISYVSLTTFTPLMVAKLFEYIAQKSTSSILALYEPMESQKADGEHSIIRSGLAYAHNYITIAKQNGFTILEETSYPPFLWLVCKKNELE